MAKQSINLKQEVSLNSYSGPIPPPAVLAEFEKIVPGSAEIIIKMANEQIQHRIKQEDKVVSANIESEKRGQWFGLFVCIFVILFAGFLVVSGYNAAGVSVVLCELAAIVGVFVYGKYKNVEELKAKRS